MRGLLRRLRRSGALHLRLRLVGFSQNFRACDDPYFMLGYCLLFHVAL
jgi:hypothetical protein